MFKHEFLKKMREYGINLEDYQIVIDEYVPVSYFLGVCKGKNKWIIYEVGDRDNVDIMYEESSKNKIFEEFYQEVLERLHSLGYVTMHISKQVIQTPKKYVCNFLQKKYNISKSDAKDIWNDLKYDFHVLNEVKYFALNDEFVPSNDCYKVEGYSAQDIYEKTYLTEIGAYNYLIYLKEDPEQALKDLKNGLPIK